MIFVTVGNATQPFRRLLASVDNLTGNGLFRGEPVIIQFGNDDHFVSRHCGRIDFLHPNEFSRMIRTADIVICHGGAGTLHHVFLAGKVPVVMPRRKKYGEHIDDNQIELVNTLASESRVIPAYEPEQLPDAIAEVQRRNAKPALSLRDHRMLALVDAAIKEILGQR